MRSEAAAIAEAFNANTNLTCDVGAILFGDAVTITADGPWQHLLYELTGRKWGNLDVENETGCGIVPYVYSDRHLVNAVQWAVGLELLLLIDDPWRVYLTTDHPNGGGFWRYPEILRLLMDVEFRKEQIAKLHPEAQKRIMLADLDRQYTFSDVAIITSAGPARALGLTQKGHLGVGADADITIYPEKAEQRRGAVLLSALRAQRRGGRRRRGRGPRGQRRAASSSCIRPSTRRSRSSFVRCSRRSTRCRSKTIRPRWSASHPESPAIDRSASMITLTLKEQPPVPLEAEVLSPDTMAALRNDAIRALPVYLGKTAVPRRRFLHRRGRGERRDRDSRRREEGQMDRPRHDPRPHQHRRQRRHASRRLHEGRHHRGVRQRLRLGRRRDVGRAHPDSRQRRRAGRRGLPRQPRRHDGRHHPDRRRRPASKSACA